MTASNPEFSGIFTDHQPDLSLLLGKMGQDRSGPRDGLLEPFRNDRGFAVLFGFDLFAQAKLFFPIRGNSRIKEHGDLAVVLGGEFTDDQAAGSGSRLPVDASKIIVWKVI